MHLPLTEQLSIDVDRCLNGRGLSDECQRCMQSCPGNAITISDATIQFHSSRCSDCAVCVGECPTEAFTHFDYSPLDLIDQIKGSTVTLHCRAADPMRESTDAPLIPCHTLLNDRLLIALRSVGVTELNLYGLEHCESCPSAAAIRRLRETLESTSEILKARFPRLHDASESGDYLACLTDCHSGETATPPPERRKFLDRALNAVAYAALSGVAPALSQDRDAITVTVPNPGRTTTKFIPQSHRLALMSLHNDEISSGDCRWFHEISGHGDCDACGICSLSCPTGALAIEEVNGGYELHHRPTDCIGCRLCTTLCPQQTLQLRPAGDAALTAEQPQRLFRCEQQPCRLCGATVTRLDLQSGLCHACKNEDAIRAQWIMVQASENSAR